MSGMAKIPPQLGWSSCPGVGKMTRIHSGGDHPQNILNKQGVDGADIVIAIFGSRLGSPTENSLSGTVEEIKRAIDAGKPVHLYFFKGASPNDVDVNQLDGLRKFKKRMQGRGLFGEYEDADTLIQYVRFGGP